MRFPSPLTPATLIRRYKRFLADAVLPDGRMVTVHCPNPGSMMGLAAPGLPIWLEPTPGKGRKLAYAWRLVSLPDGQFSGIDTAVPNRIVGEAVRARSVPHLAAYSGVRAEVRYGAASRVDFLLTEPGRPDVYVEVKNVHLRRRGTLAEFPDCVTARGAKHLRELAAMVAAGHRAVMLYVVQRTDCTAMALAPDLDPAYARAFATARAAGVEAIAHGTRISPQEVTLGAQMPIA